MAEETVVKESLTSEMIKGGEQLTKLLDDANFPVVASLWLYTEEASQWRLVLASPKVDAEGPKKAYARVQSVLSETADGISGLDLRNITVCSPKEPLITSFRVAVRTGKGISGMRFSRNRISDVLIEDAYIYRLL